MSRIASRLSSILLVIVSTTVSGGQTEPKAIYLNTVPDDTIVTLQRGACEHRCAAYKLIIFGDGVLIWVGEDHVRQMGVVKSKVNVEELKKMLEEFTAAGYFNLESEYGKTDEGCTSTVRREPVVISSVASGGLSKTIIHHHRCIGAIPDKLTALEDRIDQLAHSSRWIN